MPEHRCAEPSPFRRRPARVGLALAIALCAAGAARADDAAYEVRGLVEAKRSATLSSEIFGRIVEIAVEDGQAFKRGDALIRFDCALNEARLAVAAAEVDGATQELENKQRLSELRSASGLDVALAQSRLDKAVAERRIARINVRRCRVLAPYDGRVVGRLAEEQETVDVGQEVLEILDDRNLELELIVPSPWLVWLREGARFAITIDETGRRHEAELVMIGARIDPVSQSVQVRGRLDPDGEDGGPRLRPGMSGTATFPAPAAGGPGN